MHLQNAGGIQSDARRKNCKPEGLPRQLPMNKVTTSPNQHGEFWGYDPSRRCLSYINPNPRSHLFVPSVDKDCFIPLERLGMARTTIMSRKGKPLGLIQDNWRARGEYPVDEPWTGRTMFRVYGPNDVDYRVDGQEIREALTDWEFLGTEREGSMLISMFFPSSVQGVFVVDNQATIRILESGKSPSFRHTDKTQRVNLSWLAEQFKRKWFRLVRGPTVLQAADILTKPFTNADKWKRAVRLMAIGSRAPSRNAAIARSGDDGSEELNSSGEPEAEPEAQRLLVELCCSESSKLGDMSRKAALGCKVMRVTEKDNLNSTACQRRIKTGIKKFLRTHKPKDVMIWASLPCTGGSPWQYVSTQMPSDKARVRRHVREFNKLWKSLVATIESIDEPITIAIEWPKGC